MTELGFLFTELMEHKLGQLLATTALLILILTYEPIVSLF